MSKSNSRTPPPFSQPGSAKSNTPLWVRTHGRTHAKGHIETQSNNTPQVKAKVSSNAKPPITPRSNTPINRTVGLKRSQSISSLRSVTPKSTESVKMKKSKYSSSDCGHLLDKSVIAHYCTPHRKVDQSVCASRQLISSRVSSSKSTLNKQYHSEVNILEPSATPDYFNKVQFDSPQSKIDTECVAVEETSHLTVAVRIRPFNSKELGDSAIYSVVTTEGNEVKVTSEIGTIHSFTYDYCFSSDPNSPQYANQDELFTTLVHPLVDTVFQGYNACLFAYGQTGSGKSYSMMGVDIDTGSCVGREAGIIPRFCFELFERTDSLNVAKTNGLGTTSYQNYNATVEISYFEIYNEKIHDLLGGSFAEGKRPPLKVREHPEFGPYVVDLSRHGVNSYGDLRGWLAIGNSQRATAATGMNEKSSRSHSIFSIILTQKHRSNEDMLQESSTMSKINLVDLAGSERISQTCASGERLREGVSINRSLLTLGKVIAALSDDMIGKKHNYVPYRDSVLTWLLRESLGGNSRTAMLATISPSSAYVDETLATLRYACQARSIVNRVRINENPQDRMIRELRQEVERLRSLREDVERHQGRSTSLLMSNGSLSLADRTIHEDEEIKNLKNQLQQSEDKLNREQRSWSERLAESQQQKHNEMNYLRKCGIALQLELTQQPCLVNLAADPMISGTLLYLLPHGVICIGRELICEDDNSAPDIVLNGPLVHKNHCKINNDGHQLCLCPGLEGETFVNGQIVTSKTILHHGDRLVIGGNHYFRVSSPYDCQNVSQATPLADFQYAHDELLKIQEDKLNIELEEAKLQAVQELEEAKREAEYRLGSQRSTYEEKLKQLWATLNDDKHALEEAHKSKAVLEEQIQRLNAEISYHKYKSSILEDIDVQVSPYKSNFLQEVEDIMNESTLVVESGLETSLTGTPKSCGVSLHKMQVMVRESTQRCRDLGVPWEFSQQQVVEESGLVHMIRVRDKEKGLTSLWSPSDFFDWLSRLCDFEPKYDSLKELLAVGQLWEGEEDADVPTPNRRITVDTKIIKQLNTSLNQLSTSLIDSPSSNNENIDSTVDNSISIFQRDELNCFIEEIEEATTKVENVCDNKNEKVVKAMNSMYNSIRNLRLVLDVPKAHDHKYFPAARCTDSIQGNINISAISKPNLSATPKKSNLRSNHSLRSHKAVRFVLSEQNHTKLP